MTCLPHRQVKLEWLIATGSKTEPLIEPGRIVVLGVDENARATHRLSGQSRPLDGIGQQQTSQSLALQVGPCGQTTQPCHRNLARIAPGQFRRQFINQNERRRQGVKPNDAGRADIRITRQVVGFHRTLIVGNRDESTRNPLVLMLERDLLQLVVQRLDAAVKPAAVVAPSQGFQSDHDGARRSPAERPLTGHWAAPGYPAPR